MSDLVGRRFGRLTVIEEVDRHQYATDIELKTRVRRRFKVSCDCGNEKVVIVNNLISGTSTSCGCYKNELVSKRFTTHGETIGKKTIEWICWRAMNQRCEDKNSNNYQYYGGRGIKVCERWKESYENFLADMGRRPSSKHSIDRIDNNRNYEPENCQWTTKSEQAKNRRPKGCILPSKRAILDE